MVRSNWKEVVRTTRAAPKVLSWPGYVACSVVLSSRTPLPALWWFPYVEETGGKIFRSNGKHSGDVRIAPIADPLDTQVDNRHEGTLDVPKEIGRASCRESG